MHNSSFNSEPSGPKSEAEVLLAVTTLVTEGRIPAKFGPKSKGFREGPHCSLFSQVNEHICDLTDGLCANYDFVREEVLKLWMQNIPLCIEVILTCGCQEGDYFMGPETGENSILLESWTFNISSKRVSTSPTFHVPQLVNAIRSQLYFSQITAWLTTQDENSRRKLTDKHLRYRIALPGETFKPTKFMTNSVEHNFPNTDIGCNRILNVSYLSVPRMSSFPVVECPSCKSVQEPPPVPRRSCQWENPQDENVGANTKKSVVDDRMHLICTLRGKHHCEDNEEVENVNHSDTLAKFKRFRQNLREEQPSTSTLNHLNSTRHTANPQSRIELIYTNITDGSIQNLNVVEESKDIACHFYNDLIYKEDDKSKILLEAIERVGLRSPEKIQKRSHAGIHQNSRHKNLDLEMDYQNETPINKGTIMDVQCENDLVDIKNIRPNCEHKTTILHHEIQKDVICPEERHKVANSGMQVDKCVLGRANNEYGCDNVHCDKSKSDTCSNRNRFSIFVDKKYCDSPIPIVRHMKMKDISNNLDALTDKKKLVTRKLTFDNFQDAKQEPIANCDMSEKEGQVCSGGAIPTAVEQAKFRKNLDNAASMVFHSRTGLPLTSSPAPVRKGKTCFDFDSSINSVSGIKNALFSSSSSTDDDSESDGSLVSPCSPDTYLAQRQRVEGEEEPKLPARWQRCRKGHNSSLLGSFEESVLNGRLQPGSTVHGFTAELGASGSFVPKHLMVPVTVFFYTLGDNDKVSSPYLCHINLGKKGYCVPKRGTVQVTLFNPLGTVVKMFVIIYDLTDMPPNSQTFIRQRTLYMPNDCKDRNVEWEPKWLKYLIHLRFVSSKSGKIYLHSDIRMIIFHKSDLDTANAHVIDLCYELRSFTLMPTNPRFSPRK